jgi:hypothetical protein
MGRIRYALLMSGMLAQIQSLIREGAVRVSDHGYDELAADAISVRDVIAGLPGAVAVEEYPEFPKGPCLLALQRDRDGRPVHVVWGIANPTSRIQGVAPA